jgi:hypothetical protein
MSTPFPANRGPFEHGDPCRLILRSAVDIVNSGLQQQDAAARDGNLESVAAVELTHTQVDAALRKIDLRNRRGEPADIEFGAARHRNRVRADSDFGAGVGVGS